LNSSKNQNCLDTCKSRRGAFRTMSANTGSSEFGSDDLLIDLGDPTISGDDLDEEASSRIDYEQDVAFEDEDGELEGDER
jgi:hypothetical protein